MSKLLHRIVVVLGVSLLIGLGSLWAQSDRATITGTVTDTSGAVISGVSVTATNLATGVHTNTLSGSSGDYTIPLLRVGTYDVTAEQAGFKKYVHSGIILDVGQTLPLDIQLQVGARTETVQVTAQVELLQKDTSSRGTVISSRDIEELPIVSQAEQRNPGFYMTLSPGVTGKGTAAGTPSGSGRQLNTTVNGSQSGSTEFQLDGAVIGQNYALSGDFRQLNFPPDVVGEFNVMTLNPPAEYGQTGLGVTSFTLKSGTNQFHGTGYEYLRNEALDARGFYATKTPLNKQNEFGVTGGGPVIIPKLYNGKDRTFFYGWYSGFRLSQQAGANSLDTLPTQAMKGGDLSNLLGAKIGTDALGRPVFSGEIYDPATTRTVPAGGVDPDTGLTNTSANSAILRDAFGATAANGWMPSNIIPANQIDPVAAKMFAQFANPPACPSCLGGYINNWLTSYKNLTPSNEFGGKVDQIIGNNHRIMGEYIWWRSSPVTGSKWPGAISEGSISTDTQGIARFAHDWSLRPTLINHWVIGFNRFRTDAFPIGGTGWPGKIGFGGVPQSGPGSTFPQLTIGGLGNVYGRGGQAYSANNDFSIDEALTWSKDRHTIKMGFSYYTFQTNALSTNLQSSALNFNSGTTELPGFGNDNNGFGLPLTGMGVAGFLLGQVSNGNAGIVLAPVEDRSSRYAGFIQDDFKATSKLTLNLGLRYDLYMPTVNKKNQVSWWDPEVVQQDIGLKGALVFATPSRRAAAKADTKAFGPRIGLAYSVNDKTVIRAGYGILYTGGLAYRSLGNSFDQEGFSTTNVVQGDNSVLTEFLPGTVTGNPGYHMLLRNGWPAGLFAPPSQTASFDNGKGPISFGAFPGDGNLPYIQNWSFTIQRRLPGEILLDVGYVGTKGTHLSSRLQNSNTVPTHFLTDSNMLYQGLCFGGSAVQTCNHMFEPISNADVQALPVVQGMPIDPTTGNHSPFPGFEALWGGNSSLGQALRPFPQYSTDSLQSGLWQMRDVAEQVGVSSYNALQIQARKHFSQNLSFIASYTWSKTLTDAESLFNEFSGFTQDMYNQKAEKALSFNDYPSNLVLSYEYQLPFGPGQRFANTGGVVGKVVGGWTIAGVHQYESGAPQGPTVNGNNFWPLIGAKSFISRPNVVPGVPKKSAAIVNGTWDPNAPGDAGNTVNSTAWCNPQLPTGTLDAGGNLIPNPGACSGPLSAGLQAQNFTLGNAPRTDGAIRRFPTYNEDFSIIKRTSVTERVNVEFRADFLNIFNRTLFGFDQGGDQYGNVLQGSTSGGARLGGQANFPREIQFGLKIRY